jgi:hypothetical protein
MKFMLVYVVLEAGIMGYRRVIVCDILNIFQLGEVEVIVGYR